MTFWLIRGGVRSTDEARAKTQPAPEPLAATIDFMDVMEGELNRRLAVLAVLYYRRRVNPTFPEVALAEIEERMGFPRDYLDFTLWVSAKEGLRRKADNAQFTLTVDGVDFVETQRANIPTLHKLLTSGSGSSVEDLARTPRKPAPAPEPVAPKPMYVRHEPKPVGKYQPLHAHGPIILPSSMTKLEDRRRLGRPDRRVGKPDLRDKKVERRFHFTDRRKNRRSSPQPAPRYSRAAIPKAFILR
ncbi:MAG: hypothetical protein WDM87_15265 [Terracidiphilus sp.]